MTELTEEQIPPSNSIPNRNITPEPTIQSSSNLSEREFMLQMLNNFRLQMTEDRNILLQHIERSEERMLNFVQSQPSSVNNSPERYSKMKMDIKKFTGKRPELRYFIQNIENYFEMNPVECDNDKKKISKAVAYFDEAPMKWFYNVNRPENQTWQQFKTMLETTYGNTSEKLIARAKLQELTQTGAANYYVEEFEQCANLCDWPVSALKTAFLQGLKPNLQSILIADGLDADDVEMSRLYNRAKHLDDRFHMYNKLNKARNVSRDQNNKNNNNSDKGKKRVFESGHGNSSKALKTDDVEKSDKEKSERFCDHCKMKNHTTKNCFKLKKEKAKESKGNKDKEKEKVKDVAPEKSTKSLKGSSQ
jgi:hypothetical protein